MEDGSWKRVFADRGNKSASFECCSWAAYSEPLSGKEYNACLEARGLLPNQYLHCEKSKGRWLKHQLGSNCAKLEKGKATARKSRCG